MACYKYSKSSETALIEYIHFSIYNKCIYTKCLAPDAIRMVRFYSIYHYTLSLYTNIHFLIRDGDPGRAEIYSLFDFRFNHTFNMITVDPSSGILSQKRKGNPSVVNSPTLFLGLFLWKIG